MGRLSSSSDGGAVLRLRRREMDLLKTLPGRLRPRLESHDFLDPVVARLFPPACDDSAVEHDFKEMVSGDIRAAKLAALEEFEKSLAAIPTAGKHQAVTLDAARLDGWITFLNDTRLMLGVVLGIESDDWEQTIDFSRGIPEDLLLYMFLTHLQGELVDLALGGPE
ncbi:MAG: DUF2017 family protein [Kiritimatiellia bacterium]